MSEKINKIKFKKSYTVCTCRQVTLGELMFAIEKQGARTLDDLEELTEAGGSCGCCRCPQDDVGDEKMELYLTQVLDKFVK